MREIIYIQAGSLSNHIGTHFWNAQQSYFTYSEDEEVVINHDISFREGLSPQGGSTYCPRLLVFDRKENFGALSVGIEMSEETDQDPTLLWNGAVLEVRQDLIPEATYQTLLDQEVDDDPDQSQDPVQDEPVQALHSSDVRYWSDFNRVYYVPRTIQKLPDVAEWENTEGNWQLSKDTFERYDTETFLMEEPFRLFVEECDSLQGIHVTVDNATFGAFTDAFLTSFRDEFSKLPSLVFPILSNAVPDHIDVDSMVGIRKAMNDAMCLRGFNEISSMNIPLQNPLNWRGGPWLDGLDLDLRSPYEVSAVLSAHIETATLPLRLKSPTALAQLCKQSNFFGNTPFAELCGAFPVINAELLDQHTYNFTGFQSDVRVERQYDEFSQGLKLRGALVSRYDSSIVSSLISLVCIAHVFSIHTPIGYPLPTSFPSFFRAQHLNAAPRRTTRGIVAPPRSAPVLSSLELSGAMPSLFERYAILIEDCIRRKVDWQVIGVGIDDDGVRELRNDLWTLSDNHRAG
ncbi:hypothetical protein HETIRDRAFT_237753, partial [Heterobasidion irregulare TC 32-1]